MEIRINSDFIENFVTKYQENAAKAIKYLAVLGIHFLETINKPDLPFEQLQAFAKSFSQPKPGPEAHLNNELKVIKDELAQLNKKIDSRLGSPGMSHSEELERPPISQGIQFSGAKPPINTNLMNKFDSKVMAHKPPSAWDKRNKSRQMEQLDNTETNYERDSFSRDQPRSRASPANRSVERRDASLGNSKGEYYITPKPNEIVLPAVDLKESRNKVTRHHLDDTEAKKIMNEEGIIFFPKAKKEEVPKTIVKESRKEQNFLGESPFFGRERPTTQLEESYTYTYNNPAYNAEWGDASDSSPKLSQLSRSPQLPPTRESVATKLFSTATIQGNKENYKPLQNRPDLRKSRDEFKSQKQEFNKKNQTNQTRQPTDVSKRKSSKNRNSYSQLASSKQSTSQDYGHVASKIKDEVNYHKELSKQYKKMKQSMSQSEGLTDDFLLSNSTRYDPARENIQERGRIIEVEPAATWGRTQYQSEEMVQARTPKLMESTDTQRSSLTMQQLSAVNVDNRRPVENIRTQNRFEDRERNEEENMYRSQAGNRGGMLDIANSFLNSPLMQHITNTEKNFDTSFKDSMAYSTQNRNPRTGNYASNYTSNQDFGESNAYMQSRSGNFGTEEDMKLQSSYGLQQSKYSNAGNNLERGGRRDLKDSTNRRFQENMNNELAASYNKEGVSSLASSNFSNFLNDEMKGFYQKERLDLKKPKNSDLIMKFGSSVTSESMSFNAAELPLNPYKVEKKSQFYKNEYGDNLDNTNNKTFEGFSFDNANVFKDERMSVTQILDP